MDCWRTNKKRYRVYLIPKKKYPKVFHKDRFLNLIPVQYIFEYLWISLYIFEYAEWATYWAPGLYCKSTVFTNRYLLDDVSFQIFFLCEHFSCFLYFLTRVWQIEVKSRMQMKGFRNRVGYFYTGLLLYLNGHFKTAWNFESISDQDSFFVLAGTVI